MTDFNLWKNDITNRFSPTSLTDVKTNDIYIATAIVSGVTTNSSPRMSQWDAYLHLRNTLLNVSDEDGAKIVSESTTIQRDALSGLANRTVIYNITVGRNETYDGTKWNNTSRRSNITGITASTTQTQGNGLLSADLNVISTVANNNDTVTLPTAVRGITVIVTNNGSRRINIFPNTSDNLGEGLNTALSLSAGSTIIFHCFDNTNWVST